MGTEDDYGYVKGLGEFIIEYPSYVNGFSLGFLERLYRNMCKFGFTESALVVYNKIHNHGSMGITYTVTQIMEFYDDNDNLFYTKKYKTILMDDLLMRNILNGISCSTRFNRHKTTLKGKNVIPIDSYGYVDYRTHNCAILYIQYKFENLK